jgi:ATP-dependent protease ClpP protease subunit
MKLPTLQNLKRIERDTDRDLFLISGQGLEYGIIDEVISSRAAQKE